jgi:hypothetical protein
MSRSFAESSAIASWRAADGGICFVGFIVVLLDDIRVVHGVSPETESDQEVVQINHCRQSHTWLAKLHPEAGDWIQHPSRQYHDDAGRHFDVDRPTVSSLLATFAAQPVPIKWMPTIVNDHFLPDMGRITPRLLSGAATHYSPVRRVEQKHGLF